MNRQEMLQKSVQASWGCIAPAWSLQSFVASNPLATLYDKKFDDAVVESYGSFALHDLSQQIQLVNKETIMWLEVFFDRGQATLSMPLRERGLYQSCKELLLIQYQQEGVCRDKISVLQALPDDTYEALARLLSLLQIQSIDYEFVLSKLLLTLPGWASYILYYCDWLDNVPYPVNKADLLLLRLMILYVRCPDYDFAKEDQSDKTTVKKHVATIMQKTEQYEKQYQESLQQKLQHIEKPVEQSAQVQFVFCIDVRSERMRRHLEQQGQYETFGYAGFFGIPMRVHNQLTQKVYNSCPVLLKPAVNIREIVYCDTDFCQIVQQQRISWKYIFKTVYKALKYTFITPFALVEILGPYSLVWMFLRSFFPCYAARLKNNFYRRDVLKQVMWPQIAVDKQGYGVSFEQQCEYALQALRMIGLTKNFGKLLVLTSHGSHTENNAYATALDCGACGGHQGLSNAKLLATILNKREVRNYLKQHDIIIPDEIYVIAAEHNTTTDNIVLYDNQDFSVIDEALLAQLKEDIKAAGQATLVERGRTLGVSSAGKVLQRSCDWSQVRPEWGLSNHASMMIAPRWLSKDINLDGMTFLHSYDWSIDQDQTLLRTIMTAPMVVAHWINMQYFFSAFDNQQYGSGSKITQNITGKFGVMQGNASDLMTGLPLQSVYKSNEEQYHTLRRLTVVIYAPLEYVQQVIDTEDHVKQLVEHHWLHIRCIDPSDNTWHSI